MIRDHHARMTHDNAARADDNLDSLADQAPGNRITVGVQIDGAVRLDAPNKVAQLPEWRPTAERLQRPRLALEPFDRSLARRAVEANVRHFPHPLRQMRLECWPTRKTAASDRVALHIADAALVLPFSPGAIRRTGSRREAPVARKRVKPGVEANFTRLGVMVIDQGAGVVQKHFARNATE
jgi:hypothetical protein